MRLLVISSLAATLAGCAYVAPQDARQLSLASEGVWTVPKNWQGPSQPRIIDSEGTLKTRTKNAKSNIVPASLSLQHNKSNVVINTKTDIVMNTKPPQSTQSDNKPNVAKMEPPQATQPDNKSNVVTNTKPNIVTSMAPPQSIPPDDKFDPVITKAMATIAAKMGLENSSSVELFKVKRAKRNALGKSIDTICGYVRGKETLGADNGGKSFLYLVQEDEAYIDGYNLATSPYHNLCTQNASGLLEFLL